MGRHTKLQASVTLQERPIGGDGKGTWTHSPGGPPTRSREKLPTAAGLEAKSVLKLLQGLISTLNLRETQDVTIHGPETNGVLSHGWSLPLGWYKHGRS